jgi:hypothetical protein
MKPKYCYWSVCDGVYGALMENCVRSARQAGVFKEFHILCDRPLAGCECYDAYQIDKTGGLFKLHYLKVGMSRLNFDYFIWLDADTVFVRNPLDPLAALGHAPLHVPLEFDLSVLSEEREWRGLPLVKLRESMRAQGIANAVYLSQSAFWIVHHDALDTVYELALGFWHKAKEAGLNAGVDTALGYAMQILCADPEAHRIQTQPELWLSDEEGLFRERLPDGQPWLWRHPLGKDAFEVRPAIIHVPRSRSL